MRTPVGADHNKGRNREIRRGRGSNELDFKASNRVMGYVYICIHTVKVRINNNMHL